MHSERKDVYARVEQVMPSAESAVYAILTLSFYNQTSREVRVKRYQVIWSEGSFEEKPRGLRISPMSSRRWRVRIGPSHGDLSSLLTHRSTAIVHIE